MTRTQAGATTVEFALVLMLFLTFFLGIFDFVRMLWTWNAATEATRWGARTAVVCAQGAAAVLTNMQRFLPQLQSANVQIDWYQDGAISTTCNPSNCSGVNVRVINLNYQWISPVGWSIPAAIPMPGFSTYLPRESMGQDPNSSAICS
jgi:Flp pilus assembly protein TadG